MALRNIITIPNEVLSTPSQEVTDPFSEEIKSLISDMKETVLSVEGFGIAAPQVGVSKRVVVINFKNTQFGLINPEITWSSDGTSVLEEGCLSIPDFYFPIERPKKVKVRALNEKGEEIEIEGKDMLAKILQHEVDHINGVVIADYMKNK